MSRQGSDSENVTTNIIVAQHDGLKRRKPEQDAPELNDDHDDDVPVGKRRRIVRASESTDATTAVIEVSSSSASPSSPGPDPDARALVVVGDYKSPQQPQRHLDRLSELTADDVWGTPLSGESELDIMSVAPDPSVSSSLLRRLGAASVTAAGDVGMATPPVGRAAPRRLFAAPGPSAFPTAAGYLSPGYAAYAGYGDFWAGYQDGGDLRDARMVMSASPYVPPSGRIGMTLSPADNSPGPAYVRLTSSSSARAATDSSTGAQTRQVCTNTATSQVPAPLIRDERGEYIGVHVDPRNKIFPPCEPYWDASSNALKFPIDCFTRGACSYPDYEFCTSYGCKCRDKSSRHDFSMDMSG